jgi:regulator of sigma E protease
MLTILSFLVTLGILITIHEYGHFQVARWCGVKVLRFSLGFGRPIFNKKFGKDQTEFVIAALPLGGYVKMLDEREMSNDEKTDLSPEDLTRTFNRQGVLKRIAIVAAGPIANLLLAILLYWILLMNGVIGMKPIVGDIAKGTPAAKASLTTGDVILQVGGIPVQTWQDVRWELLHQMVNSPSVEIETMRSPQELYTSNLPLNAINLNDYESDILDQLGLTPMKPVISTIVGEVIAGGPAEKAGLKLADEIVSVDGVHVSQWEAVVNIIRKSPSKALNVQVQRGSETISLMIVPDAVDDHGTTIGRIGAAYRMSQIERDKFLVNVKYPPVKALAKAAEKTWETSIFSLKMLGNMLTGKVSWKGLSGPVTIANYAGESANLGWIAFVGFLATISISLGVLNLLPIPVLDGGHLLYYTVEIIKGSPVSERVMEMGQRVGISILGILMICAMYNDINRLITG